MTTYNYDIIDYEPYWTINVVEEPNIKVTNITLNTNDLSLNVRQEETLTATIMPDNATNKSVTWSIDDSDIATIEPWGTVKAKAEGNATITCKANDGSGVSATCTVKVEGTMQEQEDGGFKQISAGSRHTMILMTDGSLWACGNNENGQLGDGTTTNRKEPKQVMTDVKAVSAGGVHTMILKNDGSLWACGSNYRGQLGDGTTKDRSTPKKVMDGVTSVVAGVGHTLILLTNGSLLACGWNNAGQLGDGTTKDRSTPKKIMDGVTSMAAGDRHTMIVKTDGSLWACGANDYGQLAAGISADESIKNPEQVMTGVEAVAAGEGYSMILKTDGILWACGFGGYGRLGTGSTNTFNLTPEQVMYGVKAVSATYSHTMILKTDGTLWACGWNYSGQLCDGTTHDSSTPLPIMDDVTAVSTGLSHTIILKADGSLWACGDNKYGQLGDGTSNGRYTPVEMFFDIKVSSITLNKSTLSLKIGQEETLKATVKPSNATNKAITWSSSNENIAVVDNDGNVMAKAVGCATITCKANDGSGVTANCDVTVNVSPISITLPETASVALGSTTQLTPTITPANATAVLTWTSDDESIATVDDNGMVTGISKGQTYINVETDNGKYGYCKLTVTAAEATAIELPKSIIVPLGGKVTLTPTCTPEDATPVLSWHSDDEAIATVDANGTVYGVTLGLTAVTVTTDNGITSRPCKVSVERVATSDQISIGNALVAGYSSNNALDFTGSDVTAWIATGIRDGKIMLSKVDVVPANTGIYVKSTKAGDFDVPMTTENAYYVNMFQPVVTAKTVQPTETVDGVTYQTLSFALSQSTGMPAFFPNTAPKTYGDNKMYLRLPEWVVNGATGAADSGTEPVTIGTQGVAGFSSNRNLDFTNSDVEAWIATGFKGGNIQMSRVYAVPAGTGVYVKSKKTLTQQTTFQIPVTTELPYYVNMFVGVPDGKTVKPLEDVNGVRCITLSFAISKSTGMPAFFPNMEEKSYGMNKMYLRLPGSLLPDVYQQLIDKENDNTDDDNGIGNPDDNGDNLVRNLEVGIQFDEEENMSITGISEASPLNVIREMINGSTGSPQDKRGGVYDLQGRKIEGQPTKSGLYIVNGKKVVIK